MANTKFLGLDTIVVYGFPENKLATIMLKISLGDEKKAEILAQHYNNVSTELSKVYGEFKNYDIFTGKEFSLKDDSNRAFSVLMSLMKWKRDWLTDETTVICIMESKEAYKPEIMVYIFKKQ